ncbi:DUF2232 domain-containing protein [Ferroacidibacillus organovorans]|uniref:DUF2232 domain-containing protein n=1 Tax=Ferroacidibacillus organovorans TaxID=1765683 RepID=A0A101XS68_9BACL|nr:DUF2232 domain-containing protein [Ferroacidibacillus organovorans]KUO96550.1 hypothetical protein ATW55_00220 [Ferroacidibacillus organovorans]
MYLNDANRRAVIASTLFFLLLGIAVFTGLSSLALLVIPAPIIYLMEAGYTKRAIGALATAFLFSFLTAGWLSMLLLCLAVGGLAYLLTQGLRKQTIASAIIQSSLLMVAFFLSGFVLASLSGNSFLGALKQQLQTSIQANPQMAQVANLSASDLLVQLMAEVQLLLPSLMVMFAVSIPMVSLIIVRAVHRREGRTVQPFFRSIRFPRSILPIFVVSFLLVALGLGAKQTVYWQLVNNVWMISAFLLVIQAISLVWWMLSRRKIGVFATFLLLLLLMIPVVLDAVIFLGAIDQITSVRKWMQRFTKS